MPNLNIDMKSTADFAIRSAHDRFQLELDYSDQSIARLENIVTQIYWGFTSRDKDTKDGLIYNTALIWGSYLGEFMRQKWGGTWVLKGSDPTISIKNIEFAPIALILHKITDHPEYGLESFLTEAGKKIPSRLVAAQPVQSTPVNIRQPKKLISIKELEPRGKIDRRVLIALASMGGILFVVLTFIFGYRMIKAGGLPAFGSSTTDPRSSSVALIATTTYTAAPYQTSTSFSTPTLLPTYTPKPTVTLIPTSTPLSTDTPMATFTAIPTNTPTRTPLPTKPTRTPTNTHVPATEAPAATKTPIPGPTNTQPPPPRLNSCEISPSSVPAGEPTALTFIAHFNYPGIQFNLEFTGYASLPQGCTGTSGNDGTAECTGSSGLQPGGTRVDVKFTSSAGDCPSSFSTP